MAREGSDLDEQVLAMFQPQQAAQKADPLAQLMDNKQLTSITANIDSSVNPGENFYQYANGTWLKETKLPPGFSRWSMYDLVLRKVAQETGEDMKRLANALDTGKSDKPKRGTDEYLIGSLYSSAMSANIETDGAKPLEKEFAAIKKAVDHGTDSAQFARIVAHLQTYNASPIFDAGALNDPSDSHMMVLRIRQSGLSMPETDYYLNTDKGNVEKRQLYTSHIAKMFGLLGDDPNAAGKAAQSILNIETDLAKAFLSPADLQDPAKIHHLMTIGEFSKLLPDFNTAEYLKKIGVQGEQKVDVQNPEFLKAVNNLLKSKKYSQEEWQQYLRWHLLNSTANFLSKPFFDENFDFNNRKLSGVKEPKAKEVRAIDNVNSLLGEPVSKLYVREHFSPEMREKAHKLAENLKADFRERIIANPWMSQSTRDYALIKLDAMGLKIGYPDEWKDYSKLKINRTSSYVQNVLHARQYGAQLEFAMIGKPVDPKLWTAATPIVVNAFNDRQTNEIYVPAAILQPPFFNPTGDPVANYAGIGVTIGHEFTHGFDPAGSKLDKDGNIFDKQGKPINWFTPADEKEFEKRTNQLAAQYGSYDVSAEVGIDPKNPANKDLLSQTHPNAKQVINEGSADLGANTALDALRKELKQNGKANETIEGFNPIQRFCLDLAQTQRTKGTPQYMGLINRIDGHPLWDARVNITIANMPACAEAFHLTPGPQNPQVLTNPLTIW